MNGAISSNRFFFSPVATSVSRYERYASALVAFIVLVAAAVSLLCLLWLTSIDWSTSKETIVAREVAGDQTPDEIAEDFEDPGVLELADVQEPQLTDMLQEITSRPSTFIAAYQAVDGNKEKLGPGNRPGGRPDLGDGPEVGPKYIPDADRWVIRYATASREEYVRQLDYFKIELGAISAAIDNIGYATNLSAKSPTGSKGDRSSERAKKRIFFRYPKDNSQLKGWDLELLQAAGINTSGKILVQFYPQETRQMLLALEQLELGDKTLESVLKTTFGVRATETGFEYYVMDIRYR